MQPLRNKYDAAQFYYWSMHFIEPANPDDDCYVMLYGDDGEALGPMTRPMADHWLNRLASCPANPTAGLSKSA
jgi:hypothetical protein